MEPVSSCTSARHEVAFAVAVEIAFGICHYILSLFICHLAIIWHMYAVVARSGIAF